MRTINEKQPIRVVTRFEPSPTGKFHVGGVRSALYNYLFARKHGGKFILRCGDTDPVRSKKEFEDYFLEMFSWLGLTYDEYYRQSERIPIYKDYLERLIKENKAYISQEEQKAPGNRREVIRFRNPNKSITFHDEVLGDITFDTTQLGDFIIARELESPLYHFTVVVDDFVMGVTHIIRGQEHVSNTPRHMLIQEAIGAPRPIYAHGSIILNEARAKLSKRDPLVRPALEYRDEGYLPEALLNFMALLGWNPGTEKEVFTRDELVDAFDLDRMQKSGAIFNPEKLDWINKEHIKRMPSSMQLQEIERYLPATITSLSGYSRATLGRVAGLIIERVTHFGEVRIMAESGDLSYYFSPPVYSREHLYWKGKEDAARLLLHLRQLFELVEGINKEKFTQENIKNALWGYAEEEGRGEVLWPMRYALSGREKSPDPFQLAEILGKEETLRRLRSAAGLFGRN